MKKVFTQNEKFDNIIYSEQYVVNYTECGADDIWRPQTKSYFAAGKNAHKAVHIRFQKDMQGKKYKLVNIIYQ